jgi:thiosulfate/3-mercaptopyruvate sulfurtransferase
MTRQSRWKVVVLVAVLLCGVLSASAADFAVQVMAAGGDYPHPELLMEPAALSRPEIAGQFVVVDARRRNRYEEGRIPRAVWVDAVAWAKAFKDGKDAEGWGDRIGSLGIGPNAKVVVYDDTSFKDAARIWWILRYWGVPDARLLNGNWTGWQKAALAVETDKPRPPLPVKFTARARSRRLATKELLLASLQDKSLQIVDARSEGEFCGIDKEKNKRAGAIPGAKHLEWSDLIDHRTQRFKSPAQLGKLFQNAGINIQRPTATHCQSGGRASVMAFGMELMGAKAVSNYYASWAEWGNADDTPIVPGQAKKK